MKKIVNFFIFCSLFLFLIVSVFGAQQTNIIAATPSLQIESVKFDQYQRNIPIEINIHVFNSTGFNQTNSTTFCIIHLYNQSRDISESKMSFDTNKIDFYYSVPSSIYSKVGDYSYIIQCKRTVSPSQAGFVSGSFKVVNSQNPNKLELIFAILGMIVIFCLVSFSLSEEHIILKVLLVSFSLFGTTLLPSVFLSVDVSLRLLKMSVWAVRLFLLYVFLYFMYKWFLEDIAIKLWSRIVKK